MAHLSIRVLGSFQAHLDGEPVSGLNSDKVRALLVYLILSPEHPHHREVLAGLLWPEFPERSARTNLRNALANLRQVIGDRTTSPPFLRITHQMIQFNDQSDYWLDADAFMALVATVRPESEGLEQALDLVHGHFLEGFSLADAVPFEEWLLLRRERFGRQLVEALHTIAAIYEGHGAYEQALIHARRRVELEPWEEEGQRQLMRLLALSGHRSEALTRYEKLGRALQTELGTEPSAETRGLYEQIRAGTIVTTQRHISARASAQEPHTDADSGTSLPQTAVSAPPMEGGVALSALPVAVSLDAERRTVTVVRADIRGSAELLARVGTEDWAVIMSQLLRALGAQAARFGGEVERHAEDGLVACLGATTAHEDDPERAVLTALAMQDAFGARLVELTESKDHAELARDLGLLVAVHTGPVVVTASEQSGPGHGAAMGEAIAFTARMQTATKPGEVWVSEVTQHLVEPLFEWLPRGEICAGKSEQALSLYRALGRRALTDKMRGITGLSSPLIGRDAELHILQDAIKRMCDGVGGIVTLVGQAGIGKSRLVAELRRADRRPQTADGDLAWVEGRCLSYATGIAYSLWGDALRGLLKLGADGATAVTADALRERVQSLCSDCAEEVYPFLAQMMSLPLPSSAKVRLRGIEGEELRVLTFRAVEMLLACAAEQAPLVVVCEDLHWADAMSVELLQHLLVLTDHVPILWICVFRPETERGCWQVKETAARYYAHRHIDVRLDPLSASESVQLVGNLLYIEDLPRALGALILDRAEGNPFYVEEILRSLIEDGAIAYDELGGRWQAVREVSELTLPATLRGVLAARIDHLPREVRQVLQLASVVGRIFTQRLLEGLCSPLRGQGEESTSRRRVAEPGVRGALDVHLVTLQRAQMIHERSRVPEATYVFKHQLTLEAAYDSLLLRQRRVLHRRVAEVLELRYPERVEEQPGLLAHHWEQAGETKQAITYLRRAGERAAAQFANAEAIAYLSRALDLAPQGGADRYGLLLARERVYESQLDREAQGRDLAALEGLVEALGDNMEQAELAVRQARFGNRIKERAQAIAAARKAVHLARTAQDEGREAMAHQEWGRALHARGRQKAARSHLEQALSLARDAGLRQTEAEILHILGRVWHSMGDGVRGMACYEQALCICREIGDQSREGEALRRVGWALLFHFNWTESERYLQQSLNVSRATGSRANETWALLCLGIIAYHQGHYTRARDSLEQSLVINREVRDR
ncbi:MAG: AAA family ATPase [Anaerolineae bacterium]|nr:AAA family ATPase [Anaerolineae bacterium]